MDDNNEFDVKIPTFEELYNREIDIQIETILSLLDEQFKIRENCLLKDPFLFDKQISIYKPGQLHKSTIEKIVFNLELIGYNDVIVKNLTSGENFSIMINLDL